MLKNLLEGQQEGEQKPHADTKGNAWQRVCTMVRTRRCIVMTTISACAVVLVVTLLLSLPPRDEATATNNTASGKLRIVNRRTWLAQPAVRPSNGLHHPLPYVVILHTASETCFTQAACIFIVRNIQSFHIESNGWNDIGYSFLVGGDGIVYEGRGWDTEGAFAMGYNKKAIGIAFIGTFTSELPTPKQLDAGKQLIDLGVKLGKISPAYKLLAHRQLSSTESPGLAFFRLLKTWPHWAETP